jgi:hypothetical protein
MSQPQASFRIGWNSHEPLNAVFHTAAKVLVFLLLLIIGWFAAAASIVVVALGVSAALDQAGITAAVREPVLYTVLLTCGAILAIGVGGGLVKPMQARWERMLTAAEREQDTQLAAEGHAESAVGQPSRTQPGRTQRQDQPPGPRYLQSFSFSPGPGYLHNPGQVRHGDPVLSAETIFQDDPDNYPGGQYM